MSEAPQWLTDALQQQAIQLQQLAKAQTDAMVQQTKAMAQLEARLAAYEKTTGEETPVQTPASESIDLAARGNTQHSDAVQRPKPRLSHPEKFDGSELGFYPQFESLLRAKIKIDGQAIGQEEEKVWYAFGRLSGEASARIHPWMLYAEREGKFTVEEFIGQLRIAFRDPQQQQKALGQINRTKQGSRPFGEFLNEFNRLILEAEGWGWADTIKKGYLKAALNMKLLTATASIEESASYEGYCRQLRTTSDRLDDITMLSAWRTKKKTGPIAGGAPPVNERLAPTYDAMDWQPDVAVSAAHTREPRWASDEVIEQRRRAGQCLRCGLDGHRVRECRTKLKLYKEKIRAAPARKDDVLSRDKHLYKDASDSGESGKE
jgi:hypothetical protein